MPKVTGPLFSLTAAGKLGDSICFQGGPSGTRAQLNPTHPDMQTSTQLVMRTSFLEAVASWNGLSGASKVVWEASAAGMAMTGYNLYLKTFLSGAMPYTPTEYVYSDNIAASLDDCMVVYSGAVWSINLSVLVMGAGRYLSTVQRLGVGMRFLNVAIPQGATVLESHITMTCWETESGVTVNTKVVGNLQPNAAAFGTIANYQSRRGTSCGGANNDLRTVSEVLWDGLPTWTGEVTYQSPSLNSVIEEILAQGSWGSGNALALFWDDHDARGTQSDGRRRLMYGWDDTPAKSAVLYIKAEK